MHVALQCRDSQGGCAPAAPPSPLAELSKDLLLEILLADELAVDCVSEAAPPSACCRQERSVPWVDNIAAAQRMTRHPHALALLCVLTGG